MKRIIVINLAVFAFGVGLSSLLVGGEGYEAILKRNMMSSMSEESAERAIDLPRTLEEVIVFDYSDPFIPPCTLAIIADDGMSGFTLTIVDTAWLKILYDARGKAEK